jgi:hypothetical protein
MAGTTPAFHTPPRSRLRSLVWPREHGAWGMLLVPLVTGASVGNPHGERFLWVLLLAAAALGLFCLRTPVEAWLGISPLRPQNGVERRLIQYSIYAYGSFAALALAVLIGWARAYGLLLLGAVAATAFLLQAILKQLGRETRMNAQLTGAIALTSTAAGAYYLAAGRLDRTAVVVWAANWLFAANQIHFVQLRIHAARAMTPAEKIARGQGFLLHEALSLFLLGIAWRARWLPALALVAFAPVFLRGLVWFLESPRPLQVHRLGLSELLFALVFGGLFIAGYHLHLR